MILIVTDTAQGQASTTLLVKLRPGFLRPERIVLTAASSAVPSLPVLSARTLYSSHPEDGGLVRVRLAPENVGRATSFFENLPYVAYVETDATVRAAFTPNDPSFTSQWHLSQIGMETAWDADTTAPFHGGDPSIVVAVVDSGVAYEDFTSGSTVYAKAPDFAQTTFVAGYDFVNNDVHPNDDNGHGTHVAATIVESTDNGIAAAGIAFHSSLMPVKILNANGVGTTSDVVQGIEFAIANGAEVINLSLGATTESQAMKDAVDRALAANIVIVAAAGNDGSTSLAYPAAYPGVIAVTATSKTNTLASYSNYGSGVTVAAPGGDGSDFIWQQTYSNLDGNHLPRDYTTFGVVGYQGTSQAAPQVAGAAALLLARGLAATQIATVLQNTATDLGDPGTDTKFGAGLMQVGAALASLTNDKTAPAVSISVSPAAPDGGDGFYKTKPTLTIVGSDEAGGSGVSTASYWWDSNTASTYSAPLTALEGMHTLHATVRDVAGNQSVEVTVTLSVDVTGPSVTLSNPPDNIAKKTMVTLQGKVSDALSGPAELTVNGKKTDLDAEGSFSLRLRLRLGANKVEFVTTDKAGATATHAETIHVQSPVNIVAGAGSNGGPQIVVATKTGKIQGRFFAYDKKFRGGVRVASGDVTGDSVDEIITGPGPGSSPLIKIFASSGKLQREFFAYDKKFRGGVFVATGDLDGDGVDEVVTGPDNGGGPQVKVFSQKGMLLGQFFAYPKKFRGGVFVATGDLDGDGVDEVVTGPGAGTETRVKIFSMQGKLIRQFSPFGDKFRGGVRVAAGDLQGDGEDELIAGPGPGGGPQVKVFALNGKLLNQFFAYDKKFRGGVYVGAGDTDGDGNESIITGPGESLSPLLRTFSASGKLQTQFHGLAKKFTGGLTVAANFAGS